jgi:hypothetical protein
MKLVYKHTYFDDERSKQAFIRFLIDIHHLDLSLWSELGYWDDSYTPFSYFDDEEGVVASVQVYSMDMMIKGNRCRVAQFESRLLLFVRRC